MRDPHPWSCAVVRLPRMIHCCRMTQRIVQASSSEPIRQNRARCKLGKGGAAGLATRPVGEHRINTRLIDSYGGQDMLDMCFGSPIVARTPQTNRSHRRRMGGFDARTQGVLLAKGWRALELTLHLQGFLSHLWTHTQHPSGGLGMAAIRPHRTARAGLFGKDDLLIQAFGTHAGTRLLLGLVACCFCQSMETWARSKPCWLWPANCSQAWSDPWRMLRCERWASISAFTSLVSTSYSVGASCLPYLVLHTGGHLSVRHGSHRGVDLDYQLGMEPVVRRITSFRQMDFGAQPRRFPFVAGWGLRIIKGADHVLPLVFLQACPPCGLACRDIVIRLTDLTEQFDTCQGFGIPRRLRALQRAEPMKSVGSDLVGQSRPLTIVCPKAIVLDSTAGAVKPVRTHLSHDPLGSHISQIIESGSQMKKGSIGEDASQSKIGASLWCVCSPKRSLIWGASRHHRLT